MQPNNSANSKRIAKNTLLLYVRMLFLMLISLYTSRVILNALGVEDYGIYNVVGGVVTMFSVVSGSLSTAISRYITFELGKGNPDKLKKVFSSSVTIQGIITLVIILLAETVGLWFLNEKMVIPDNRMVAANWCYQLSIITFSINLISVPYNAAIIAHEKMSAFAYISILEALGKLIVAICIIINPIDRLIFFATMMSTIALIIRFVYSWYCKRHFEECSYHISYDSELLKQMFGFASWNFIGSIAGILRSQGINILMNLFGGAPVNAARGITVQVHHAVGGFVKNFMMAVNPQITKSYSQNRIDNSYELVLSSARLSFFLLFFLSLPIAIELPFILGIWLTIVPEYTIDFVRLSLLLNLCECTSYPLITLQLATGNVKKYQLVVGGLHILNFPISFVFLKLGFSFNYTYYVAIFLALICLVARLVMLRENINISIQKFFNDVIAKVSCVSFLATFLAILIHSINIHSMLSILLICTETSLLILFLGLDKKEVSFILKKLQIK